MFEFLKFKYTCTYTEDINNCGVHCHVSTRMTYSITIIRTRYISCLHVFCFQHNYIFINTDKLYFEFGIFLLLVKTFCWYLEFFLVKGPLFYVFITNILFWLKHQTKDWFTMRWWRFKGLYNCIIVILLLYC